jgi:TldD protein
LGAARLYIWSHGRTTHGPIDTASSVCQYVDQQRVARRRSVRSRALLDLLTELMDAVPARCAYAEARAVARRTENVLVRDGHLERVDDDASEGVGVRVRSGSAWGFAATGDLTRAGLQDALARAIAVAESQPRSASAPLAAIDAPARGTWRGPCDIDPFSIPLTDKLTLLVAADEAMRGDQRIVRREAECHARLEETAFASTEGASCAQTSHHCGGGIGVVAVGGEEVQFRTYPLAHGGDIAAAGWEHVLGLNLAEQAPRIAAEAVELLTAPPCPSGRTTLILHDEQMALQIHESIGHALELDRMLLFEASYAGTSWVTPTDLGSLRYGSPALNITADATLVGGLGSFGWDDEGVPGSRTPLIVEGELRAALADRASAAAIGMPRSGGCARADGFSRQPIVRMTNVSLEAGSAGSLDDLIADTDDGLYLETNRSWSIDDRRLHFQFGTEVAREIRDGKLGRLYRNPSYAGITPEFWGSMDAVCSAPAWRVWGLVNCGKGEPGQVARVSHGAAPARFRNVEVGVA